MDVPRAVVIAALLAAALVFGQPARAQTDVAQPTASGSAAVVDPDADAQAEQIARWTRVLERVGQQLQAEDLSLANLSILEETVDGVRDQARAAQTPYQKEIDRIGELIRALGPAPAEGEPPEAENIAVQRRDLAQLLSVPEAQMRELELLIQRASLQAATIDEIESTLVRAQLLVKTPSLLSAETWTNATSDFATLFKRVLASPGEWFRSPKVRETFGPAYLAGLLIAVVIAAVLGAVLRRWLIRHFGRIPEVEDPSFRMRVIATIAEATANTVVPVLITMVTYFALLNGGLLFGVFGSLVLGVTVAVVWASVLRGLPRAILSPSMPQWRLTEMGDLAARLWDRRAFVFAVLIAIDQMIFHTVGGLQPSLSLRFTYALVVDSLSSAVFLAVVLDHRLWRTSEEEARALAIKDGRPPMASAESVNRRSRWWNVGRAVVAALAIAIPVAALAGYGVLSDEIAWRMKASAGIFLVALVLHGLARDLVALFTREDERPPGPDEVANPIYVWSVLLLDVGLVVSMVFFMVPLWGGRWDTIVERIGWIMTGFNIGGYTFSLTDVLMGMVVFVVLMIAVRLFQRFLDVRVLKQTRMDAGVRNALKTGIGYAGVVLAALVAINTAGIDLSGLAIIAGALSVGIGFGMQSIVNNFVSGLILLIERPIKVGDWVVVGQDQGYVKKISVRSTQIQTFSNASVIIPNSELIAGRVTNWMYKDRSGRVELPIGVAYGSDTGKVREVLLGCARDHDRVKAWPQPQVVFLDFGDSALLFELRFYVANIEERLIVGSDIRFAVDAAFREAGITIPFPQRDVHIFERPGPAEASVATPEDATEPEGPAAVSSGKVLPIHPARRAEDPVVGSDSDK